jgi:hypothetical protein
LKKVITIWSWCFACDHPTDFLLEAEVHPIVSLMFSARPIGYQDATPFGNVIKNSNNYHYTIYIAWTKWRE